MTRQAGLGNLPLIRFAEVLASTLANAFTATLRGSNRVKTFAFTLRPMQGDWKMDKKKLRKLLQEHPFSVDIPAEALKKVAANSILIDYPVNSVLFREGAENHNLYLICQGSVTLEMCVPARGCVRLLSVGAGEMLAWSALLGRGQMTATATADEDTQVLAVPADKLLEICESHPDVGYHLMRQMASALSRRLLATRLQLLDLFSVEPPVITN